MLQSISDVAHVGFRRPIIIGRAGVENPLILATFKNRTLAYRP